MIEMTVESVRINLQTSQRVVILKATKQDRYLFIWIAHAEAYAIAIELQGTISPRPLTHDLFINLLRDCELKAVSCVISDIVDDIFHSYIEVEMAGKHIKVDARPSDAIAIAVRAGVPIYVEEGVLARSGVSLDSDVSGIENPQQQIQNDEERLTRTPSGDFTEREREVLTLLAHGSTNKQIADTLGVSEKTISKHINLIIDKLRLSQQSEVNEGFLQPDEESSASIGQPIQEEADRIQEPNQEDKDISQIFEKTRQQDRDRFDKFTERARRVLSLAHEEARRFQHNYIGTEHLLLGLVREGEGVAAKVLSNLGVELNKVRSAIEFIIGQGDSIVSGEIGLTPRSKKVIELAVDEARRLNHHYIGTEHLLLGLVREGEGIAVGVLESLGANLEEVRTQTLEMLKIDTDREDSGS